MVEAPADKPSAEPEPVVVEAPADKTTENKDVLVDAGVEAPA